MKPLVLEKTLKQFDAIATRDRPQDQPAPYLVDVWLNGAGDDPTFSGTMLKPDMSAGAVAMQEYQYGPGTDYGAIMIDIENIAAVRMRKPL